MLYGGVANRDANYMRLLPLLEEESRSQRLRTEGCCADL